MRLLCALGLFLALLHVTSCLLIGAFNIQCFGPGKFDKPEAIKIITKIVQRYDIILIQEVRCNKDLIVPDKLKDLVNQVTTEFSYISSEPLPLGSGSHRERYVFLYRDKMVTKVESFQYPDTAGVFSRPPFVVKFSSRQTDVKEFVLIPIHTKPGNAVEEIDALVDVVKKAKSKWTNNNIMVLGDFNADGTYVTKKDWKKIRLFTDTYFHWLINDGVDTTVAAKSSNTYDRIVVTTEMNNEVVKGSAKVIDFIKEYNPNEAKKVSDHFPVEVELEPEVEPKLSKKRRLNPN